MDDQKNWTAIFEQTFAGPVSAVDERIIRRVLVVARRRRG
jgi:hypothetical protein